MYQTEALEDLEEARPNRCRSCLYHTWKIFTCIFSHIILVSLVVAYCILGAFTFETLESQNEVEVKANIWKIRKGISDKIWDMTKNSDVLQPENWTREVKDRLKEFEQNLLDAMKKDGWDGTETAGVTQWTFAGALFYSIIVITTIGYGHIAPKTHWGKVVTIFYAILGIPLMLLCLSNIGDIMAHSFRFLYWRVCCYMCTRKPKRPPSRRGRSVRGTVRSSRGDRSSGRSKQQSFKHPGMRTSTRSADSALGLSESMTRSSYSDTECRYNDDNEMNIEIGGQFRASQHSRYSDTAVPLRTGDIITPTSSIRSKNEPKTPPADMGRQFGERGGFSDMNEPQIPVLFNKYALDRDESMRAQRPGKFLNRSSATLPRQHHQQYYPNPQYQSLPYGGSLRRQAEIDRPDVPLPQFQHSYSRSSKRAQQSGSSPRVMSPMGYAIPRQTNSYRPPRLGRLREDMDYIDYEFDDYEYETNSGSQAHKIKPVPIWLCVFLVLSYIFGGAFLFSEWEQWHFLDSAYFCFITLTTIGFGDFVPAQRVVKDAEISIALCSLYLLFGIALLAMSFNLVQEEVINNVKSVAKRLGIIKDDEEDEE